VCPDVVLCICAGRPKDVAPRVGPFDMVAPMPKRSFFDAAAKARTTETIREIESLTAAEVVVTVRPRAAAYFRSSLLFAAACAAVVLTVMMVSPRVYDVRTIPLDTALTFLVALPFAHFSEWLKRRLTPRSRRHANVKAAALKAFQELGIEKTRDRTGLLVFVSLLEREVLLVPDEGIQVELLSNAYRSAEQYMRQAVEKRDLDGFLEALRALGPSLAELFPRLEGDENELCDHVA
jgi:putative membrane protein